MLRKGKTGLLRPVLRTNGTLYGAYLEFSDSFSRKLDEQRLLSYAPPPIGIHLWFSNQHAHAHTYSHPGAL